MVAVPVAVAIVVAVAVVTIAVPAAVAIVVSVAVTIAVAAAALFMEGPPTRKFSRFSAQGGLGTSYFTIDLSIASSIVV